jgi:hypothetical protein
MLRRVFYANGSLFAGHIAGVRTVSNCSESSILRQTAEGNRPRQRERALGFTPVVWSARGRNALVLDLLRLLYGTTRFKDLIVRPLPPLQLRRSCCPLNRPHTLFSKSGLR